MFFLRMYLVLALILTCYNIVVASTDNLGLISGDYSWQGSSGHLEVNWSDSSAASDNFLCNKLISTITKGDKAKMPGLLYYYFLSSSSMRSHLSKVQTAKVKSYKNSASSDGKVIDLGSDSLFRSSQKILDYLHEYDFLKAHPKNVYYEANATKYAEAVIELKKGDTVVFGEREFRLGNYLGAGNATHIFQLADYPHKAIRIPLSIVIKKSGLMNEYLNYYQSKVVNWDIPYSRVYLPQGKQGSYAVVDYINSNINGQEFLALYNITSEDDLTDEQILMYRQLKKATKPPLNDGFTRQLVWHLDDKQWVLVDWE